MEVKLKEKSKASVNICPITNIRLIGDCPNYECPANLVRLTGGKKTGCYHAKSTVSIQDFALLWKVDAKTAQARYSNSISTLEKMTTLFTLLQQLEKNVNGSSLVTIADHHLKTTLLRALIAKSALIELS